MLNRFRPWIAAALALAIVGLGHAYLRRWGRGLLWLLTVITSSFVLHSVNDVEPVNPITNPEGVPIVVLGPITVLILLSALDAFVLGRRDRRRIGRQEPIIGAERVNGGTVDGTSRSAEAEAGAKSEQEADPTAGSHGRNASTGSQTEPKPTLKCPHCGKETDAELDFCHWCTEPLSTIDEE
ncbi:zinc ribbon domain-containing protein [Halopenitus sp. H-Gu1]|uniref:DUF7575 domain-containing protein n=1 Tax=Halopenitus sp. H-Gu1 TaxID=3242697 RepID=UPI00359D8D6B